MSLPIVGDSILGRLDNDLRMRTEWSFNRFYHPGKLSDDECRETTARYTAAVISALQEEEMFLFNVDMRIPEYPTAVADVVIGTSDLEAKARYYSERAAPFVQEIKMLGGIFDDEVRNPKKSLSFVSKNASVYLTALSAKELLERGVVGLMAQYPLQKG